MNAGNANSIYQQILHKEVGSACSLLNAAPVSGGCINNGMHLKTNEKDFFLKWNSEDALDMFEKEFESLEYLRKQKVVSIPEPCFTGSDFNISYLVLEFIESGRRSPNFWSDFGEKLASLHQASAGHFGFDYDNYIGSLPQRNEWNTNWVDFFIEQRLKPQLLSAQKNGLISNKMMDQFHGLFELLPSVFPVESPALIHGDLWSGNIMTGADGIICLIDPAVYFGNREIEIAFTHLFGGFDHEFYDTYEEVFPLQIDFENRIDLYNLYPLLVHVNLFGASYLSGIKSTLQRSRN